MKNIAIIPARSGSKGLKDKNIRLLNGKPLMAYSIEAAQKSGLFDEIFVSTDSEEYAQIAREWGANVPFLRSELIAGDTASSWDAVKEAINHYGQQGKLFDTVTLLQPTSPLRTAEDIIEGYKLMEDRKAESVIAVCEMDHSPLWSNVLPQNHCMSGFIREEVKNKPRQELPAYYRINGALYIVKVDLLAHIEELYNEKCFAYVMPREKSIDIDTMIDFSTAEAIMKC